MKLPSHFQKKMKRSIYSSGVHGAVPYAPGLNGTVRVYHAGRAVHLDHEPSGNLVFVQNTAAVNDAGGTVVLSPSGPAGMAIHLLPGLFSTNTVRRPAPAAAAQGPTSSRYRPAGV